MALFEDAFKGGNLVSGLALGLGALIVVPLAISVLRPLAKAAIKGGIIAYDQGAQLVTELNRATTQVISEAQSEVQEEASAPRSGAGFSGPRVSPTVSS